MEGERYSGDKICLVLVVSGTEDESTSSKGGREEGIWSF